MKQILFFLMLCPLLMFGQWQQVGNDIDGDAAGDRLGIGLRMNADGSVIAVASLGANSAAGKVRVFGFDTNTNAWAPFTNDGLLGEAAGDDFGTSIGLSADGNIVAVGAPENNGTGTVKVYSYDGTSWIQMGSTIEGIEAGERFGVSTKLNADGTVLAISASSRDSNGVDSGSAVVYKFEANNWVPLGNELVGDFADNFFGFPVEISNDGTVLLVGASSSDSNGNNEGQVKVFQLNGNTWEQIGNDLLGLNEDDRFGARVSMNNDGSIISIGALNEDGNGFTKAGSVRVFKNVANSWEQVGSTLFGEEDNAHFTRNAINGDGTIIAISAVADNNGTSQVGQVKVFQFIANDWVQVDDAIYGDQGSEFSGSGLVISDSGERVAMGSQLFNGPNGSDSGRLRVFENQILGTEDVDLLSQIAVYPNPVSEILTISNLENKTLLSANIYSVTGRLVKTFNLKDNNYNNTLDFSSLTNGVYFLKIQSEQTTVTKKIIKK